MNEHVAQLFASGFLSQSLARQIADCDRYELTPLFLKLFRDHQPVLEAGCGSGRWCGWFQKNGIRSDGVDWSQELCDRAAQELAGSRFVACDMQNTPFEAGAYGGLIALGSIEHSAQGPLRTLQEFHRLLRPDGVAVITVPYGGRLRLGMLAMQKPLVALKACGFVRRLFGKSSQGQSLKQARGEATAAWHPQFSFGATGWSFYEYIFTRRQMRQFLAEAKFAVVEEFAAFGDEGILHNFGRLAGKWNESRCDVDLTLLGKLLRKTIPVSMMGHMLCYVVKK